MAQMVASLIVDRGVVSLILSPYLSEDSLIQGGLLSFTRESMCMLSLSLHRNEVWLG